MRAIVNTGKGKLEIRELPMPEPEEGEVRIKTSACAICSTDFTMIDGCGRSHYPAILGHEWSGIVDKAGKDVSIGLQGVHCVGENILDRGEVGFEFPGGYGEFFITEADKLLVLPEAYSLLRAALIEPLAVSLRGMKRLRVEQKDNAMIFGDGPIGLIMLMLLKREQVKNIAMAGGRPARLKLASELGADCTINYHEEKNLSNAFEKKGFARKFSNIIEASGTGTALESAVQLAARNAHILMIGDYDRAKADIPLQKFLHLELELIASNAGIGFWKDAFLLAVEEELPLKKLISHVFPAEEFAEAMRTARDRTGGAVKVIITWDNIQGEPSENR